MKKRISFIIFSILTAVLLLNLSSCNLTAISYSDSEKYSAGNAELNASIDKLDIDWLSGSIKISYHDSAEIHCYETANRELKQHEKLRWFVDGTSLKIKFSEAGSWKFRNLNKTLEIVLPTGLELSEIKLSTISADASISSLNASRVKFESVSGSISLNEIKASDSIKADSVSGNISLSLSGAVSELDIETTSGNIDISAEKINDFSIETTSGEIDIELSALGREGQIDSTSGDITLTIPESSSFKLEFDTVSGDFECEIPTSKKFDYYIAGDGSCELEAESVSGDLEILIKSLP